MARRSAVRKLTHGKLAILFVILALLSWPALFYLSYHLPPAGTTLPAFFALFFVAISTTAVPFMLWLERRLHTDEVRRNLWRPIRQGMWLGLWATLCVWLQLMRLLDWITAILFLVILALIEWFIISRKR